MSKIKSPREKKKLSLARDRRNTYGENPRASREGIHRGKQRSHMEERRAVDRVLRHLREKPDENEAIEADVLIKDLVGSFSIRPNELRRLCVIRPLVALAGRHDSKRGKQSEWMRERIANTRVPVQ